MEELNKKISGLRAMMKEMKAEMYAIVNPDLVALDEYIRNLYLKILCTVVQYESEPSEMQVLYLKRIVRGIGVEENLEEHMRKALTISEVDVNEFISFMKENKARYYFALDSILLLAMGNSSQYGCEYVAEIIELCGITMEELRYISLVAKSVLQQESSYFEEAKEVGLCKEVGLNFLPYMKEYFSGLISYDNELVYYYNKAINCSDIAILKSNKIIFENCEINIGKVIEKDDLLLKLVGCKIVEFVNCRFLIEDDSEIFLSSPSYITINACDSVVIDNCEFIGIDGMFSILNLKNSNNILIKNSKFYDCNFYNSLRSKGKTGSIVWVDGEKVPRVSFYACEFRNCIGKSGNYNTIAISIVTNCDCKVELCKFYNVWNYTYTTSNDYRLENEDMLQLFTDGSENINNEIVGSAKFNDNDNNHRKR